jgi:hypothetical protein
MWTSEMFAAYLKSEYKKDVWEEGGLRKEC